HNGENVGGVDDEWIGRDAEDQRNRVDSKDQISRLDHDEDDKKGCCQEFARFAHEELAVAKLRSDRHQPAEQANHRVLFGLDLLVFVESKLDAGKDQEAAEDVGHPMELVEQGFPSRDENGTHDQCAEDPPEEDTVLVPARNLKVVKNQKENEQVIDAQRQFEQITGNEQ